MPIIERTQGVDGDGNTIDVWTRREHSGYTPQSYVPAPAEQRASMTLTFPQLLIGLVAEAWITLAEGDAWLSGVSLPATATGLIAGLPVEQQFPAKAKMMKMTVVERLDPLVSALATLEGKTDAEVDTFFLTYAQV